VSLSRWRRREFHQPWRKPTATRPRTLHGVRMLGRACCVSLIVEDDDILRPDCVNNPPCRLEGQSASRRIVVLANVHEAWLGLCSRPVRGPGESALKNIGTSYSGLFSFFLTRHGAPPYCGRFPERATPATDGPSPLPENHRLRAALSEHERRSRCHDYFVDGLVEGNHHIPSCRTCKALFGIALNSSFTYQCARANVSPVLLRARRTLF